MAAYDLLAPHYDAVTGDAATEAAFIQGIIERRHNRAATLLDLGCGTGGMTELLAGAYQVSGLDISPGMLAVARGKLPQGTPLYLADMSSFRLDVQFDAIVCAYQGINHLLSFAAWQSTFDCVREHLGDGGQFVFDITTVSDLTQMASSARMVQQFADNYLVTTVRTADGLVFDWQIEVFELQRDGMYKLLTQTVATRSFPVADIAEALRARFTDIEILADSGHPDNADRIWFAGTRRG
jgi:SAM-dependent methyltransferase